MAKALFLTFVALTAGGLAFADYTNQTVRAGAKLGDIGLREYVGTFTTRYHGMQDGWQADALAADLRSMNPRELLPADVDGWTMREWNEADRARLFPAAEAGEIPAEFLAALEGNALLSGLQAASTQEARAAEQVGTRFYQKGDSLIALQIDYRSPRSNAGGMQGLAINIVEGNMAAMSGTEGFAIVKGVAFGRSTGMFGVEVGTEGPRVITGRMGDEIRITARALASDDEVYALLSSIDYDTLNTMMVRPLDSVGSKATDIPLDQQRVMADEVISEQTEEMMARARESEAAIIAMGDAMAGDTAAADTTGIFGMGAAPDGEETAEEAPPAQVRRIGNSDNCVKIGARKSCGVQGD